MGGVFFSFFPSFPFKFVLLQLCRSICFRVRGRIIKPVFLYFAGDVILFHALRPQTHASGGGDHCCFFIDLFSYMICIVHTLLRDLYLYLYKCKYIHICT